MDRSKKEGDKGRDFTTKSAIYLEYIEPTLNRRGAHGLFSLELEAFSVGRWRSKLERIGYETKSREAQKSRWGKPHTTRKIEETKAQSQKQHILKFYKIRRNGKLFFFFETL